ncbi:hypothetical protein WA026_012339 [Henosepilachna vigintioctopunctata]|uniref:PiggyBac transposable element-derived protein domain-containing protein n=1 Tax=Henosepilachna vigintioctopunctata TaxID=420089 RepID=A0AAW1UPW0_9CUCU
MNRNKDKLSIRKPTGTSSARARDFSKIEIFKFLDILEEIYNGHNFSASGIFNVDETGLTVVQSKIPRIIALRGKKQTQLEKEIGRKEEKNSKRTLNRKAAEGTRRGEAQGGKKKNNNNTSKMKSSETLPEGDTSSDADSYHSDVSSEMDFLPLTNPQNDNAECVRCNGKFSETQKGRCGFIVSHVNCWHI